MRKILTCLTLIACHSIACAQFKILAPSGNTGIGTATPSQKLVVNGNALLSPTNGRLFLNNTNRYVGMTLNGSDLGLINKEWTWLRIGSRAGIAFWGASLNAESTMNSGHNMFLNEYGLGIGIDAMAYPGVSLLVGGNVQVTGSVWTNSDRRFKKQVTPIEQSTEQLVKLNAVSYEYDTLNFPDLGFPNGRTNGFIAQEMMEVLPELVHMDGSGYYAINYQGLIPLLVDAIKEQQSEIHLLRDEIHACCTVHQDELDDAIRNQEAGANSDIIGSSLPYLLQNKPNPFSKQTVIHYGLPKSTARASILIFDLQGALRRTYELSTFGESSLIISAGEFAPGMYIYTLVAEDKEVESRRMIITD